MYKSICIRKKSVSEGNNTNERTDAPHALTLIANCPVFTELAGLIFLRASRNSENHTYSLATNDGKKKWRQIDGTKYNFRTITYLNKFGKMITTTDANETRGKNGCSEKIF